MLRDDLKQAQISAMKGGDKARLAAIRLILAKIKDRDIEERGKKAEAEGRYARYTSDHEPIPPKSYVAPTSDDEMIIEALQKMAKQRRESITMYVDGNREELAEQERKELKVIEEFLPRQMDEAETKAAIDEAKSTLGTDSIKDMGKVMAELKGRHGALLDMQLASRLVKESFG